MNIEEFIAGIPKAELHVHLCGALEPELMFRLAQKNEIPLRYSTLEKLKQAYHFENLQDFLDLSLEGSKVIRTEDDFYELTLSYIQRAHKDNVIHAEIFFEPQMHTVHGITPATMMGGIMRAFREGKARYGITCKLILCVFRNYSEKEAFEVLEGFMAFREDIQGIGLDSAEVGYPPSLFAQFFSHCKQLGFQLYAHAGEEGPPSYVQEALDVLKVDRIDHGVRSSEDLALMNTLAQSGIPLTVCPLSNVYTKVYDSIEKHSIKLLMDHGVNVSIHSDDPAYFGGYINANYLAVQEAFDLDHNQIVQLVKNSFNAAYLTESERLSYLEQLDAYTRRLTIDI